MSIEVLQALINLFAIICKQDGGASIKDRNYISNFLKEWLAEKSVDNYLMEFDAKSGFKTGNTNASPLTSVADSVHVLKYCKQINKTLVSDQKYIVLLRLFEITLNCRNKSPQSLTICRTVASIFNITKDEVAEIESFLDIESLLNYEGENILCICPKSHNTIVNKHLYIDEEKAVVYVLHLPKNHQLVVKNLSKIPVWINGQLIKNNYFVGLPIGSSIRIGERDIIYYSVLINKFIFHQIQDKYTLEVKNLTVKFNDNNYGVRNISFTETEGKLIAIMGSSGSGKSTLLNCMAGITKATHGSITLNGIEITKKNKQLKKLLGLVPQTDVLIEELSVYENLYYNALFSYGNYTSEQVSELVTDTLKSLGLYEIRELKVGGVLDKIISGGQRKRLNIALEIMRKPPLLFVDEPTSGLSSKDSKNVMDLLREFALKGNMVFVVIHQPSADIYKMFDKVIVLDTGGYLIYEGNPLEAISYFKKLEGHVESSDKNDYFTYNPEIIFDIVDTRIIDEYGKLTAERKILPEEFAKQFDEYKQNTAQPIADDAYKGLHTDNSKNSTPGFLKQISIYLKRDLSGKIADKQYLLVTLLEIPFMAFLLSSTIAYTANNNSEYVFKLNENIPAYLLMIVIISLFVGLTVSAEEIYKDRKLLLREEFLNLKRSSYLLSKTILLFGISAIQSLFLVFIGNGIIGIYGLNFEYFIVLFSVACFANMLGLTISSAFKSAVTIYILIPLLIIPQMVLAGAMFEYEKINRKIGGGFQVPIIAELMASRWAYEALAVNQFVNNKYQQKIYDIEQKESYYLFKQNYLIPYLKKLSSEVQEFILNPTISNEEYILENIEILKNELRKELQLFHTNVDISVDDLSADAGNVSLFRLVDNFIDRLGMHYKNKVYEYGNTKDLTLLKRNNNDKNLVSTYQENYFNEHLSLLLRKRFKPIKYVIKNNEVIRTVDPIYINPKPTSIWHWRYDFYVPHKYLLNKKMPTLYFNLIMLWLMSLFLYIALYFKWLSKFVSLLSGSKRL